MITNKIENAIFTPLKTWTEQSNSNWNMLIGIGLLSLIIAMILIYVLQKKMGMSVSDERTSQINLKSALVMLYGVILFDLIFPKEYMWQIFFLFKYSFALFATGIYLAIRYKRDFLS
ncbi:DUF2178 domain-containing protein [Priestia aryabhattai]|uniref:DUF2178 domain-containing protein n=1 Tax=Priestia aryabhattai TaxID=412384 RepID=UPI001C8D6694|nr:DUF2178 domain-containing protein [Priestia aryabhattai]MBY0213561.1 DUF2178 domain-containing protein [Priestia aryabhattai]